MYVLGYYGAVEDLFCMNSSMDLKVATYNVEVGLFVLDRKAEG